MSYSGSKAFAGRGTVLQYSTNPPSVAYIAAAEIKKVNFNGRKLDLVDVTNFQSGIDKEWLPTLIDNGDLAFEGNLIPNDTTETDLLGFFHAATLVTFQVVLPAAPAQGFNTSLGTFTFKAFVAGVDQMISHDKDGTFSGKLKITGAITYVQGS